MDTASPAPLGRVIADEAAKAGLSVKALSEATGIPRVTLRRRIVTGRGLRVDEIEAIAAALNTTATALMARAERAGARSAA